MNNEDLIFSQYKLYSEAKEKFVDRSFAANKFYLLVVIALFTLAFVSNGISIGKITAPVVFTFLGMISSTLWWLNIDSYNCLIKIKFSKVLEEIEKQLPMQPYAMEYKALKDYRNNKKGFVYSDIQKTFAILSFLIFFSLLLMNIVPTCVKCGL